MSGEGAKIRKALVELVARKDPSVFQDVDAFDRAMRMQTGIQGAPEIEVLKAGLQERIPWELREKSTKQASQALLQYWAGEIARKYQCSEELAAWAMESWALAVGLTIEPASPPDVSSASSLTPISPGTSGSTSGNATASASSVISGASGASASPASPATGDLGTVMKTDPSAGIGDAMIPTTRLGLIYGMDDRGCVRVFQVWWKPMPAGESSGTIAQSQPRTAAPPQPLTAAGPGGKTSLPPALKPGNPPYPTTGKSPAVSPVSSSVSAPNSNGSAQGGITHGGTGVAGTIAASGIAGTAGSVKSPGTAAKTATTAASTTLTTKATAGTAAAATTGTGKPPTYSPSTGPALPAQRTFGSKGEELYAQAVAMLPAPGVKPNVGGAVKLLQQAFSLGHLPAAHMIGRIFLEGIGVKEDPAGGVPWLRLAAERGVSEAQVQLGNLYQCGFGVDFNLVEARNWFQKAADQGNAEARDLLNAMNKS
ncbi:MAG: tetratricopeptide repeat protein [Candidatus Ozemobacteraceae bacterium]